MNPAQQFVQARSNTSPVHRYVADHGQAITSDIDRVSIAGHQVGLSEEITQPERSLIRETIRATEPSMKECFANALKMWEYDRRFKYAEGFAVPSGITNEVIEHAWCMLDGTKIIDFTPEFDHHYGVVITSDSVLERHTGSNFSPKGIIGNHSNRYEFLRERGYV